MGGVIFDAGANGLIHFILLTVVLGGAGAIASGRSIAGTWRSFSIVPVYMVILAAVLRFLQYALFQGDLLNGPEFLVTLVVVLIAAACGYRSRRAEQMSTQYSWLYTKSGPLGWVSKGE